MKVINMFGGPCSGKSTASAGLFYKLKMAHINCELVTEYAKDLTWENRQNILSNQTYILGKQYNKLKRLDGKVDYAITDSPLLLNIIYSKKESWIIELAAELFNEFDNVNFFLPIKQYTSIGRNQTYEEAIKIEGKILKMLKDLGYKYTILL